MLFTCTCIIWFRYFCAFWCFSLHGQLIFVQQSGCAFWAEGEQLLLVHQHKNHNRHRQLGKKNTENSQRPKTFCTTHRAMHQLTFMRAMIQKAYATLAFSSTGSECGEFSAWITGDLKLDLKSGIISVAFSVLLLPRQCSDMKGSAIRGLTRAPSPMKKCSAWKERQDSN